MPARANEVFFRISPETGALLLKQTQLCPAKICLAAGALRGGDTPSVFPRLGTNSLYIFHFLIGTVG